jgi:hypothetical protein
MTLHFRKLNKPLPTNHVHRPFKAVISYKTETRMSTKKNSRKVKTGLKRKRRKFSN